MSNITIAFDLYGTILSTSSISTTLSSLLDITPEKAIEVAELWRRYQLEYTWRANCMKKYQNFTKLTISSLHHALAQLSIPIPSSPLNLTTNNTNTTNPQEKEPSFQTQILESYNNLTTFPDASAGLSLLLSHSSSSSSNPTTNQKISPYIFSNGTLSMISSSIKDSLSASANPFWTDTDADGEGRLVSIDSMGVDEGQAHQQQQRCFYKPAPEAYEYLLSRIAAGDEDTTAAQPLEATTTRTQQTPSSSSSSSVWLVSSNPFDIVGAKSFGLRTAWVDRSGLGWVDALADDGEGEGDGNGMPDLAVDGVDDAIIGILEFEDERRGGRR